PARSAPPLPRPGRVTRRDRLRVAFRTALGTGVLLTLVGFASLYVTFVWNPDVTGLVHLLLWSVVALVFSGPALAVGAAFGLAFVAIRWDTTPGVLVAIVLAPATLFFTAVAVTLYGTFWAMGVGFGVTVTAILAGAIGIAVRAGRRLAPPGAPPPPSPPPPSAWTSASP
ncbi:MAG TPA: hypothetical protein VFC99_20150, partial [Acidimicrobiia bacterium]|nr:hypothetical protein [Acidimicrobiia bacterium]